jgi:hypothetical protein
MRWRVLFIPLAIAACQAPPPLPGPQGYVPDSRGGWMVEHAEAVARHRGPVRLFANYRSGGALWLGHPEACILPSATFEFHAPSYSGVPMEADEYPLAVAYFADHLPPRMGAWYRTRYSENTLANIYGYQRLTAQQVVNMGGGRWCS